MKLYLKLVRFYYKTISSISPRLGGWMAFNLFQKVRKKEVRRREEAFL